MSPHIYPVDETLLTAFTPEGKKRMFLKGSGIEDHSMLLLLSILGNDYCKGPYLTEILRQALDKKNNLNVTCLITNDVHRHNLKGMHSSKAEDYVFTQQAIQLGAEYLQETIPVFLAAMQNYNPAFSVNNFTQQFGDKSVDDKINVLNNLAKVYQIPLKIELWNKWTADDDYESKRDRFAALVNATPKLKDAINETANSFARRKMKDPVHEKDTILAACTNNKEKFDLLLNRSIDYLAEECFAIYYLGGKRRINLIGYSSRSTKAFREAHQFIITDTKTLHDHSDLRIQVEKPGTLLNWIQIDTNKVDAAVNRSKTSICKDTTFPTPGTSPSSTIDLWQQHDARRMQLNTMATQPDLRPDPLQRSKSFSEEILYRKNASQTFFNPRQTDTPPPAHHITNDKTRSNTPIVDELLQFFSKHHQEKEQPSIVEKFVRKYGLKESRYLAEQILMFSQKNEDHGMDQRTPENTEWDESIEYKSADNNLNL